MQEYHIILMLQFYTDVIHYQTLINFHAAPKPVVSPRPGPAHPVQPSSFGAHQTAAATPAAKKPLAPPLAKKPMLPPPRK